MDHQAGNEFSNVSSNFLEVYDYLKIKKKNTEGIGPPGALLHTWCSLLQQSRVEKAEG